MMSSKTRTYRSALLALFIALPISHASVADSLDSFTVSQHARDQERLFDGVVEAVNQTTVSAQTAGRVIEINFDIDDNVEKDDILIKISNNEQSASATQAAAAVSQARSQLTLAKNNFERFKKLHASQTISKAQFDDASSALSTAQANLKTALAARDQAQKQLDYTVVRAPYGGIVTARLVELGETVSPGAPLMSGFSTAALRVKTEVPNRFAQLINAEKGVDIVQDNGLRIHSNDVTVFPFANLQSNSVTVRVNIPVNTANIYPGMLTKIAFKTTPDLNLLIPQSAVFIRSELTGVYVLEDDSIRLRRISIGNQHVNSEGIAMVKVLSGLVLDEKIAKDPIAAVKQLITQKAQHAASEQAH